MQTSLINKQQLPTKSPATLYRFLGEQTFVTAKSKVSDKQNQISHRERSTNVHSMVTPNYHPDSANNDSLSNKSIRIADDRNDKGHRLSMMDFDNPYQSATTGSFLMALPKQTSESEVQQSFNLNTCDPFQLNERYENSKRQFA